MASSEYVSPTPVQYTIKQHGRAVAVTHGADATNAALRLLGNPVLWDESGWTIDLRVWLQ